MISADPALLAPNEGDPSQRRENTMDVDTDVNGNEISQASKRVS